MNGGTSKPCRCSDPAVNPSLVSADVENRDFNSPVLFCVWRIDLCFFRRDLTCLHAAPRFSEDPHSPRWHYIFWPFILVFFMFCSLKLQMKQAWRLWYCHLNPQPVLSGGHLSLLIFLCCCRWWRVGSGEPRPGRRSLAACGGTEDLAMRTPLKLKAQKSCSSILWDTWQLFTLRVCE